MSRHRESHDLQPWEEVNGPPDELGTDEPGADPTVPVALPPRTEAMGRYAEDKLGGAMHRLRRLVPHGAKIDNRRAGVVALAAGGLAMVACYLTWIQIEVAGHSGPGSVASGLDGRDGVTVLVAGGLAAAVAIALLFGRGDGWLKMALFVTGGIITIIGVVDIVDVRNKVEALEDRFGVREGVVTAQVGVGLWLVLASGVALLAAGLLARRVIGREPAAAPATASNSAPVRANPSVTPDELADQR